MSIKCPGHVSDITTIFRQQCPSTVQGMYVTLQLYLGNNVHQMFRVCTSHYHYIYAIMNIKLSRARSWYCHYILAIMFIKCPGHVPDTSTIFRQKCPSNVHGMYRHYHCMYAIMTIKCSGHLPCITSICRQ